MQLITLKKITHLENKKVVIISKNAVHIVLWTTNSTGLAYDTNLKKITPIIPHHNEAPMVNNEPSKYCFFIIKVINTLLNLYMLKYLKV